MTCREVAEWTATLLSHGYRCRMTGKQARHPSVTERVTVRKHLLQCATCATWMQSIRDFGWEKDEAVRAAIILIADATPVR